MLILATTRSRFQREGAPPDERCVSFTHDRDYLQIKCAATFASPPPPPPPTRQRDCHLPDLGIDVKRRFVCGLVELNTGGGWVDCVRGVRGVRRAASCNGL
jgi:hypothetical protein